MKKKGISIKEMILLGILLIILVYYFVIHQPVVKQTADIESEQADILSELEIQTALLTQQRNMENAIEEAFEAADGNPVQMPSYDNSNAIILELNSLLSTSENYNVDFGVTDSKTTPYVLRRNISLSFSAGSYELAMDILRGIKSSRLEFQINNLNLSKSESKTGEGGAVSVSLTMTCCEYTGS